MLVADKYRRNLIRQGLGVAMTVAYPTSSLAATPIVIVVDSEGENATNDIWIFNRDSWPRFYRRVFYYLIKALGNKIREQVGGRYPTYDIHIAIRQTFGALGVFSITNFLDSNKRISLTHLAAVFAVNIVPAVTAGFGQELLQLELRNRGVPVQVAKYAAGGLIGACIGFWTFYGVPTAVSAMEKQLGWEKQVSRRRRLHEYADTNFASLLQMLNGIEITPLANSQLQITIYGYAPLENQLPPITDALYQYLTVDRYVETRTIIVGPNTDTSVSANIQDLAFENGNYTYVKFDETIQLNPDQLPLPLRKTGL